MLERDKPGETWVKRIGTVADLCICDNCNRLATCGECQRGNRTIDVTVLRSDEHPYTFEFIVHVLELHSRRCTSATNPSPGSWLPDVTPQARKVGPRNRFEPISASAALSLNTSFWGCRGSTMPTDRIGGAP